MVDGGGQRAGELVHDVEQRVHCVGVLLGQIGAALRLRLAHHLPEFLLLRSDRLEGAIEFGHECVLLWEVHARERRQGRGHRRHFGIADAAEILLDVRVHRRVGIKRAHSGRAVGAQIVHRLEQVRRGVRDDGDAAGDLQAIPGVPGIEREADHDAEGGGEDDGLQQRGNGQTIEHGIPQSECHAFGLKTVNT
ncbi:hypothetical protein ES707_09076 [subsurface metagenome]